MTIWDNLTDNNSLKLLSGTLLLSLIVKLLVTRELKGILNKKSNTFGVLSINFTKALVLCEPTLNLKVDTRLRRFSSLIEGTILPQSSL